MLNRSLSLPGRRYTTDQNGRELLSVVTDHTLDSFNFTGFGNGDFHSATGGTFSKKVRKGWSGTVKVATTPLPTTHRGAWSSAPYPVVPTVVWTGLIDEALSKVYEKIRSGSDRGYALDSADLSVDAFQSKQTRDMLKAVTKTVDYVRSFHPKHWAKKWLEYQYGWKPLLSTIYGIAAQNLRTYTRTFDVQVGRSSTLQNRLNTFPDNVFTGIPRIDKISDSQRVEIKLRYLMDDSASLAKLAGYTSLNPLSIAWELVPYSFVVDWFYNLGGYLRTMETAVLYRSRFVDGYRVITRRYSVESISKGSAGNIWCNLGASYVESQKIRSRLTTAPIPNLPRPNYDLGGQRLLSAAALLETWLRSKR